MKTTCSKEAGLDVNIEEEFSKHTEADFDLLEQIFFQTLYSCYVSILGSILFFIYPLVQNTLVESDSGTSQ